MCNNQNTQCNVRSVKQEPDDYSDFDLGTFSVVSSIQSDYWKQSVLIPFKLDCGSDININYYPMMYSVSYGVVNLECCVNKLTKTFPFVIIRKAYDRKQLVPILGRDACI